MSNKKCKSCNNIISNQEVVMCEECENIIHKECSTKIDDKFYCDLCLIKEAEKKPIKEVPRLPDVIRRSHIDDYLTCPYFAYHILIKEMQFQSSSFAQIGIDLHDLFYNVNVNLIDTTELYGKFQEIFKSYSDNLFESDLHLYKNRTLEEHKEVMFKKGIDCINNFCDLQKIYKKPPFKAEEKIIFTLRDDLPKVSITMDRIDEVGDALDILDYKTGSVLTGVHLSNNLQVPLYIYAVQQEYGRQVNHFNLYYLDENKVRTYTRVNDNIYTCSVGKKIYPINIRQALDKVIQAFEQMKNGKWSIPKDTRSMYFTCKSCQLRKIGGCDGADAQLWKTKGDVDLW